MRKTVNSLIKIYLPRCKILCQIYRARVRYSGYSKVLGNTDRLFRLLNKEDKRLLRLANPVTLKRTDLTNWVDTGLHLRSFPDSWGRSSHVPINQFMLSTLHNLGGSETHSIHQRMEYTRYGGGRQDALLYLKQFNKPDYEKPIRFKLSVKRMLKKLGLDKDIISPYTLEQVRLEQCMNLSANPGPSYKAVGCRHKRDSYDLIYECADLVCSRMREGATLPFPLYGLGGRNKLLKFEDRVRKQVNGMTVGRAVWMSDGHESVLSAMFTLPFMKFLKTTQEVILLGYDKFGPDVQLLMDRMGRYDTWICADISKLDSNLKVSLLSRAFLIIESCVTFKDNEWMRRLLGWLKHQYIYAQIVLPNGEIVGKRGGSTSGSGFVSLINSLCVAIVYIETIEAICGGKRGVKWDLAVYGDNSLFGFFTHSSVPSVREKRGKNLFEQMSAYILRHYGLTFKMDETRVAPFLTVRYGQPIIPESMRDFSSDYIRSYRRRLQLELGRRLTQEEKVKILLFEPDGPCIGGNTHRWTYVFAKSAFFLSYYFHEKGRMIRPTNEVIDRLLHVSKKVSTLKQHRQLLMSALIENQHNQHTVNRIMHYMYDAQWMSKLGIITATRAKRDVLRCKITPPIPRDRSKLPLRRFGVYDRAWYRKQQSVIEFEEHPEMDEFMVFWRELLGKIPHAFDSSVYKKISYYQLRRSISREVRGLGNFSFSRMYHTRKDIEKYCNAISWDNEGRRIREIQFTPLFRKTSDELKLLAEKIITGSDRIPGPSSLPWKGR